MKANNPRKILRKKKNKDFAFFIKKKNTRDLSLHSCKIIGIKRILPVSSSFSTEKEITCFESMQNYGYQNVSFLSIHIFKNCELKINITDYVFFSDVKKYHLIALKVC